MKKIIIINPREGSDFSMDLIYAGLVRKFGQQNVIDWPIRAKHRAGVPKLIGDHEKDYGAERGSLCYVEGCENFKSWSRQQVISEIMSDNIEYVFMDETQESFQYYKEIYSFYNKPHKIVVVAGHDCLRTDLTTIHSKFNNNIAAIFIDDWQEEYNKIHKTHLINLSDNFSHLWDFKNKDKYQKNKLYDLCFVGYNSNPIRRVIIQHIRKNWSHLNNFIIFEERPNMFDKFIRHNEMYKIMAQSKVCLNIPGASTGGRALRYYEIPHVGSCMLTMRFPAKLLFPFENTKTCLEFSTLDELDMCIDLVLKKHLNNRYYYDTIAEEGNKFHLMYHTIDARISYVFYILENNL